MVRKQANAREIINAASILKAAMSIIGVNRGGLKGTLVARKDTSIVCAPVCKSIKTH